MELIEVHLLEDADISVLKTRVTLNWIKNHLIIFRNLLILITLYIYIYIYIYQQPVLHVCVTTLKHAINSWTSYIRFQSNQYIVYLLSCVRKDNWLEMNNFSFVHLNVEVVILRLLARSLERVSDNCLWKGERDIESACLTSVFASWFCQIKEIIRNKAIFGWQTTTSDQLSMGC